jgi:hypothetical protein
MNARPRGMAGWNFPDVPGVKDFDNPARKKYKRTVERETKEAALTRKFITALALGAALLVLSFSSAAAGPMAAIKGRAVDDKGAPLNGAYLYVTSPSSPGIANAITSASGHYGIIGLAPGTYKVVIEMPGFKTVSVDGIVLSSGMTVTVDFKMEPTDIEEEAVTARPGSMLDRDSARAAVVLDRDLITRLPLARDFNALLGLVPGLVYEVEDPGLPASIEGGPELSNILIQDGIIVTHPVNAKAMGRINIDIIDEVVVETAGHAADAGPAQGTYVNVVHRPGSRTLDATVAYSVSGKGLVDSLWTADEIAEMDGVTPTALRREHDLSLSAGGPVLEDMAWFFSNFRFKTQGQRAPYRYWTDPLGVRHFVYDYAERDLSGMFKLSMNVLEKFKGVLEAGFSGVREPVYSADVDRLRPESSTRQLDGEKVFFARGGGSYIVSPSMRVDLSVGYANHKKPLLLNATGSAKPQYVDVITGRSWGSGPLNERETASRMRVGASVTKLLDDFMGMSHEISLGGDYETTFALSSTWKADNLIQYYADGSPYTYGLTTSPASGDEIGWGLIGFYIAPAADGSLSLRRELKRIGAYAQDTMKLFGRLSLSAGLRFDRSEARFAAVTKGASGNAVSVNIGNTLIDPLMGYNPYSTISLGAWDKSIVWNALSPRFGLTFDVLGRGRTLFKASWARTPEYLGLGYSEDLAQINPRAAHTFLWFDEDGDGKVGTDDGFSLVSYDFRVYKVEFFRQAVDPKLSAPVIEEWTAGLEQQIARDFTLSARYIVRNHTNNIGSVAYDPSTGAHWARLEDAPDGWWIPFSTIVPGVDGYPDVPATLYFPASTAPDLFERIENVPELVAKYRSLEFAFRKRMSRNWQLFGSLVWNRATGTTTVGSRWSAGSSPVILTPNSFINLASTDRLLQDRPLVARLAGTVRFRGDIYASFLLKAQSGAPWARTVTVVPPSDWAVENGAKVMPISIYLESPGSRRFGSWKDLDFRLEKEFSKSGRRRFSISVDVLNLLGDKYRTFDLNDGGTWLPDGEGVTTGTRRLSGTYSTYWPRWGSRVVRFNLNLGL